MSFPRIFQTDLTNIPAEIPYIGADADQVARWRERFASIRGLNVGLAFAGGEHFASQASVGRIIVNQQNERQRLHGGHQRFYRQ